MDEHPMDAHFWKRRVRGAWSVFGEDMGDGFFGARHFGIFAARRQPVYELLEVGGRDRVRTCDLMLAKHALSQLSYTPVLSALLV
jgi:hypothetical protein